MVKPGSDTRLSEKFLAPSKTPDNGRTEQGGGDKSDRSPWSFSGDSLLFQTPRVVHDTSSAAKVRWMKSFESTTKLGWKIILYVKDLTP